MDETLLSQSSPVTTKIDQPSRKRRLSSKRVIGKVSKRAKPSSHTLRLLHLYLSPVVSTDLRSFWVNLIKKKTKELFRKRMLSSKRVKGKVSKLTKPSSHTGHSLDTSPVVGTNLGSFWVNLVKKKTKELFRNRMLSSKRVKGKVSKLTKPSFHTGHCLDPSPDRKKKFKMDKRTRQPLSQNQKQRKATYERKRKQQLSDEQREHQLFRKRENYKRRKEKDKQAPVSHTEKRQPNGQSENFTNMNNPRGHFQGTHDGEAGPSRIRHVNDVPLGRTYASTSHQTNDFQAEPCILSAAYEENVHLSDNSEDAQVSDVDMEAANNVTLSRGRRGHTYASTSHPTNDFQAEPSILSAAYENVHLSDNSEDAQVSDVDIEAVNNVTLSRGRRDTMKIADPPTTQRKKSVNVSSYRQFKSLLEGKTKKSVALSFNVSNNVDSHSYSLIVNDLIANSKLGEGDKIKHPRYYHRPLPVVPCRR